MTPVKASTVAILGAALLTGSTSFAQNNPSEHLHQLDASVQLSSPRGYAPLKVQEGAVAGFALKVAPVELRPLRRAIRTFGVVTLDETRTSHVHPKVHGTLESVTVNSVGKAVRQGIIKVATNIFGLLPVLFDNGVGADVAKRIAGPMWGGALTLLTLLIVPAAYVVWRATQLHTLEKGTTS